jgi:hypothetical protein
MAGHCPSVIVVSVLPRGEPYGGSSLVALDRETLDPLEVREFPADEYLEDPELGAPGRIRHARGLATVGDKLYVALFNVVREYTVEDSRTLALRPGRLFTHPRACDLHGICVHEDTLVAASTGTDSVISWDLASATATVTQLGTPGEEDVRFPDRLAREAAKEDWREALDVRRHLNGVSIRGNGAPVVCSLGEVFEISGEGQQSLYRREAARMHDGYLSDREQLLLTDAAVGGLISHDLIADEHRSFAVAKTDEWFVRGVGVVDDGTAYVLSSERMRSRQRSPVLDPDSPPEARGAQFMVSTVDFTCGGHRDDKVVRVPDAPRGSVVYGIVELKSDSRSRD